MWENYALHEKLHDKLFENFDTERKYRILDTGSGGTSLYFLTVKLPYASITTIVYPGNERKIKGMKEFVNASNYTLKEIDIKDFEDETKFDIVLTHLLLGEATKFGNTFDDVLNALFSISTDYLAIVDILEDPEVNHRSILRAIALKGSIRKITCLDKYREFLILKDK